MSKYTDSPVTFKSGEAIAAFLRVVSHGRTIKKATSTEFGFGVTINGVAINKDVGVRFYTHGGTCKMTASGVIVAGREVYAANGGKIAGSGTITIGTALDSATGDGSVIEVIPHIDYDQRSSSSSLSSSSSSLSSSSSSGGA